MRAQRGASGLFVLVVIALAMVAVLALGVFLRVKTNVDDATQTTANLKTAAAALDQFAGASGRLPCPADPSRDTGLASPVGASRDCDFTAGTLPWATIGMRRDDAYDAWGWKISYRVYSNANGSLTQANGASMVNCNTVAPPAPQPVDGNGQCPVAHQTLDTAFLAGKGLSVTDFGNVVNGASATGGAAYVLISHGATGLGAWTAAGVQKDNPKSNDEKNNTNDTGPFTLEAASGPEVPATDNSHYDDVLFYRTVLDLAKKANLAARDWTDLLGLGLASIKFDTPTLTQALGVAPAVGSLGTATLHMSGATVTASSSSISFDAVGGVEGIGVSGGGSNAIQRGESLRVDLSSAAGKLAITLNNAGTFFGAQIQFFRNGSLVDTQAAVSCHSTAVSTLNSFTFTPVATFDRFVVSNPVNNTAFLLSEFRACTATQSSCVTSLDTPTTHCP